MVEVAQEWSVSVVETAFGVGLATVTGVGLATVTGVEASVVVVVASTGVVAVVSVVVTVVSVEPSGVYPAVVAAASVAV
mgnify:FL=1